MMDLNDQQATPPPTTPTMPAKKMELLSTTMKRTSEWFFSQEVSSDVTIQAGGTSFSLHKFPLTSKCGYIRKLVSESSEAGLSTLELANVPGGAKAFELAAKFCYGINFEISIENIAMLRCVAEYLDMTEDAAVGNLVGRTEAYLNEVALKSLASVISVLHSSENLLPTAEEVKIVSRCVDMIAYMACKDSQFCKPTRAEIYMEGADSSSVSEKNMVDWWAEDLTVLNIDFFQRVLIAMIARGFKQHAIGPILVLYAQNSFREPESFGKGRKKIEPRQEHEKRVVVETIVSLLPRDKNAMSVSFLSMLLRAAIHLETTVACRLDLEKRIGLQLDQAVLDDLLIPSFSFTGQTLFDVDSVERIVKNYLEYDVEGKHLGCSAEGSSLSPPRSEKERVGKLLENYLAEIASDRNLSVSRFIDLAELIPEQSSVTEDCMYRAIDIYLKAHPDLSDTERKKVCSVMNCQKLSREAYAHAVQNDRLPVQTVVQVLYHEQLRLREAMTGSLTGSESPALLPQKSNLYKTDLLQVPDDLSGLKRENQELKLELVKMKMRLKEVEKLPIDHNKSPLGSPSESSLSSSADHKPRLPRKSFINTVSKNLGRLYPFFRTDGVSSPKDRIKRSRDRRHSIS
ncbi:phototropic-responsive NPH3 family protein [Actinidia rufa]|uniref:Phototropic-responsive NPH3 family protein n=1 Tax=Actinidia rufa TaxID=165716 RepID=A0A7J0F566_9ERIC|nr:phototropic-responsive NPH3 family protein [Actinidia rufa]